MSEDAFNPDLCSQFFKVCLEQDISLKEYCQGYELLCRLINQLGSIFKFVTSDITDKMDILKNYLAGPDATHYCNLQSFIHYEVENDKVDFKKRNDSGCRTFLRLHRALLFVSEFLKELQNHDDAGNLSGMTWKVYEKTLGKYHNWGIRKLVGVALYTLPTKRQLILKMLRPGLTEEELIGFNTQLIEVLETIYSKCQEILEEHKLLELP
ncbi:DgyrCDS1095 [Dimorphilus gyrociliatus]|uniref:DgyrCDS1095 n=1 Tax=Dimorphilus gyrociliatus TaxID=2664684 RepID=A0A7I8V692_9ANNE|nr:DgyrCDS1095 [Dimorphilus gyrociliatus]